MTVRELALECKAASTAIRTLGADKKNNLLAAIAASVTAHQDAILAANAEDVAAARANGITESLVDRLTLTAARLDALCGSIRKVIALPDPVGGDDGATLHPNGMRITCRRVPLGVVGMIFEARPNVTVDSAVLALKSGNVCLLRGGKEAICSNKALTHAIHAALREQNLPEAAVSLVTDTDRSSSVEMMGLVGILDLLIPRGGAGLIRAVVENAKVPVVETGVGNCHVYVESTADLRMALDILENAKCQRPSVCNAAETLLVDATVAEVFLPQAAERLAARGVTLHGCPETCRILGASVIPAEEKDFAEEYLDLDLAVRVTKNFADAVKHIETYASGHTETIVTQSYAVAKAFEDAVDAAAVCVNTSTRFTDGEEFGLGAEIGISTQKIHVRGPMGLAHLTTTKYVVEGNGQIRD